MNVACFRPIKCLELQTRSFGDPTKKIYLLIVKETLWGGINLKCPSWLVQVHLQVGFHYMAGKHHFSKQNKVTGFGHKNVLYYINHIYRLTPELLIIGGTGSTPVLELPVGISWSSINGSSCSYEGTLITLIG